MTVIGTTEPPRLPVRDKAAAHEGAGREWAGGLSPMLTRLAAERATGVLVREHGTLHLAEGEVVHAESPYAPGLDVLLTAHGTVDATVWQEALTRTDSRPGVSRLVVDGGRLSAGAPVVDGGRLSAGALELCQLGALYDAAYFALAPSSTPGRFRYGSGHPPAPVRPVAVAAVERETLRRRELLRRVWPDPLTDSAPLVRADPAAAPAVTARQAAVLARVDGVRTATDIARELGRQAFHTLVDVRRLAAAGLVAPHLPAARVSSSAVPSVPSVASVPDPDITLLKRLRDALEAL
ncbi:transcriptional regulator [Streptomyces sp. NPDC002928]|uniref:transcriptional regulator n=1 Tax=Streptomyces sp. NPDC002928 TaxID=3154440 RepID=UPI0033AA34CE